MKKRILSLLLSLVLLMSLVGPETIAYADGNSGSGSNKGMELEKTATPNGDGTYTITLKAYATGSKTTTQITKDKPTDIILVLDQSGSMDKEMGTVSFKKYEDKYNYFGSVEEYHTRNQDYYEYRHNGGTGNLWYRLDDGSYVSVSVNRSGVGYSEVKNGKNNDDRNGATNLYQNRYNLYVKKNNEYVKVTVTYDWGERLYQYTLPDGTEIASSRESKNSPTIKGTDDNKFYIATIPDSSKITYTYTYTDANIEMQTIGTSEGADTVFSPTLYKRTISENSGGKRIDALKNALTSFIDEVATKAKGDDGQYGTDDDIEHRIAVVGFAQGKEAYDSLYTHIDAYHNTGIFIGSTQHGYNGLNDTLYQNVYQKMNTENGYNNVKASKDALATEGATSTDLGLTMANNILKANTSQEDVTNRNRVVIVFTDGAPTTYSGFARTTVAQRAIDQAKEIKEMANAGVTIYSVGIFAGANARSAGTDPVEDIESNTDGRIAEASNWFMQQISSNENGQPRNPSYYLSAADADTLNSIFKQIAENIEQGGSSVELDSSTVIKDTISEYFQLPDGADENSIILQKQSYIGENKWGEKETATGASAEIVKDSEGNQVVEVTGFDFKDNWCGTETGADSNITYRGNKLVISFKVVPKAGFLGGNKVPTNAHAGVYENKEAKTPIDTFTVPKVNVPIKEINVNAEDKNVYLKGGVTADELKNGLKIVSKDGKVTIDLSKPNYGLEPWQNEFVNDITIEVVDKSGNVITDINDLTDDSTYTVSVKVSPKYEGTATEESGNGSGTINVFKPELTFNDGEAYYGEDATKTDFTANKVAEVWKHGTKVSTDTGVTIIGNKPELKMGYTTDATKLAEKKYYTKQDLPVKATVKIGEIDVTDKTTFVHQDCNPKCKWDTPTKPGDPAFLMHIKTCELKITKNGGANGEPYVFTVMKDGTKYSEVTIVGNGSVTISELPVGTYSIVEDTGWSWRYTPRYSEPVTLSSASWNDTLTCTNKQTNDKWLNEFSAVVKNIFVKRQTTN